MMFAWLPVYTTDVYIQRHRTGNNFRFCVTFIRGNELNGQIIIYDNHLVAIIALRNLVTNEMQEEISLDRLMIHL